MHRQAIGIDIGGSSIKSAVVDLSKGCLVGERRSVPSPAMSAVSEMLDAMAGAVPEGTGSLMAGVTFPGVVVGGTVYTAANVAKAWIGQPLAEPAALKLKRNVIAINDADAAGLAEVNFGAARDVKGTVLVLAASAPASAARCSSTANSCRTPNSATSNSTAWKPKRAPPAARAWSASSSGPRT